MLLPSCLFAPRLGNTNPRRSRRRVQSDVPLLVSWKALRWQGQASAGSVLGLDVSALGTASSIPLASTAIGGREVLDAPALPPNYKSTSTKTITGVIKFPHMSPYNSGSLTKL
jgi:hypothetical protein